MITDAEILAGMVGVDAESDAALRNDPVLQHLIIEAYRDGLDLYDRLRLMADHILLQRKSRMNHTVTISPEARAALTDIVVGYLNSAVAADRPAIHALLCNRVPCNQAIADHPHVVVDYNNLSESQAVGALGLLNGLLTSLGLPRVAADFAEHNPEIPREVFLKGFVVAPTIVQPLEPDPAN